MRLLLGARILVWAATDPNRLSKGTCRLIEEPAVRSTFSVVHIQGNRFKLTVVKRLDVESARPVVRQTLLLHASRRKKPIEPERLSNRDDPENGTRQDGSR